LEPSYRSFPTDSGKAGHVINLNPPRQEAGLRCEGGLQAVARVSSRESLGHEAAAPFRDLIEHISDFIVFRFRLFPPGLSVLLSSFHTRPSGW